MPADGCGKVEIECAPLEKCLRECRLIPDGCKLDEGKVIRGGKKGYVFKLKPTNDKDTRKDKKK